MDVKLYKIWTKTNNGPWTFDLVSLEDRDTVVLPYNQLIAKQAGFKDSIVVNAGKQFSRIFILDSIDNAKALYALLNDLTIPEVKAMNEMRDRYDALYGTTTAVSWKLTKVTSQ